MSETIILPLFETTEELHRYRRLAVRTGEGIAHNLGGYRVVVRFKPLTDRDPGDETDHDPASLQN